MIIGATDAIVESTLRIALPVETQADDLCSSRVDVERPFDALSLPAYVITTRPNDGHVDALPYASRAHGFHWRLRAAQHAVCRAM